MDQWKLEGEFLPAKLLDLEAANEANAHFDVIWNFRDEANTDIFDQSHKLSVRLLCVSTADGWKIAGIECAP